MPYRRPLILVLGLLFASPMPAADPPRDGMAGKIDKPTFAEVRRLVTTYCGRCHGEKVQKGGVDLVSFADETAVLRRRKLWRGVAEQLHAGQMPPEDAKQPTAAERDRLAKWITGTLDAADRADREKPDPGRTIVRRLTRTEYDRTVRDLTGVVIDTAEAVGMPDDTAGEAFDNLAAALSMTASQMEKYFAAADLVLDKLYAPPANKNAKNPDPDAVPPGLSRLGVVRPGKDVSPRNAARAVIGRFARKAYRRPVTPAEVERLLGIFDRATATGAGYEMALRPVFKATLVSPNFLLRVERDRAADPDTPYRVSDHELAVRLSYFLWATMPDDELGAAADRVELSNPAAVEKQVRRMLADPKARALTDTFAAQWLRLGKVADARPSTEFFPTFTQKLRQAMVGEVATFFDKLRAEDRSVLNLLAADYTYVNGELAAHYGVKGVSGPEFRRVPVPDPDRGGLLGMAAVLSLTSHTSRTSPTLRGKYVLDVILGTPPPPPPPNVSQIDEGKKGKEAKTFRELLARHASQPACANCHAKIDPLGFGLETFDPIGRVRKTGKDVDATGKLPTGETFNGPRELRQVLLKRKGRFAENLTEKLLVYALGRELQPADAPTVNAITADLAANDYRFSRLVLGIAASYPFQHRRNLKADEDEK